jgi:urease accessory protein UreF
VSKISYIFSKGLEKIIERDFFPDLERLRLQREYLAALERNDLVTLRELYSKYRVERDNSSQSSARSNRSNREQHR